LELEETLDVVIHIATPHSSFNDRGEVVISDQNIGRILAHVSAGLAHSEADISFLESGSVICSITCYSDDVTHLAEASNEQVLIFRAGSGEHS
jgi:hypothetical protein